MERRGPPKCRGQLAWRVHDRISTQPRFDHLHQRAPGGVSALLRWRPQVPPGTLPPCLLTKNNTTPTRRRKKRCAAGRGPRPGGRSRTHGHAQAGRPASRGAKKAWRSTASHRPAAASPATRGRAKGLTRNARLWSPPAPLRSGKDAGLKAPPLPLRTLFATTRSCPYLLTDRVKPTTLGVRCLRHQDA